MRLRARISAANAWAALDVRTAADVAFSDELPPWTAASELDGEGRPVTPPGTPRRISLHAPPAVTAPEVAVLDDASGLLLYGERAHARQAPARTTKLVAVMVALELEPSLDAPVAITVNGWAMAEADGSSVMA